MLKQKLRVFEAFAGVGSQRMALRNLGIDHEVVGIAEIDKYALKSYEAIHGDCPNFGDISKLDPHTLPDMDLFTYSFPCQDLSQAGRQNGLGKGTRSGLLYECEKIIETKKPKYLLLENVKALVSKKFKGDFMKWLEYLESLGYTNYWDILNAKDYGVPQNRERVFVVSILGDHDLYALDGKVPLDCRLKDLLEQGVDEKFYMDKPFTLVDKGHVAELDIKGHESMRRVYSPDGVSPTVTTCGGGHREPKILVVAKTDDNYEQDARVYSTEGLSPTLTAHDCRGPKKILVQDILEDSVDEKFYLSSNMKAYIVSEHDKYLAKANKFVFNKTISATVTTREGNTRGDTSNYLCEELPLNCKATEIDDIQKYRMRKLTPLECWRLMGFSDEDFKKAKDAGISNSQLYKQAGNSIVVPVLEAIFGSLFKEDENE